MKDYFIETFTGKLFSYKSINPESICIDDIAHHLSHICRFTGACREHYSVAEHSARVSYLVPHELRLAALLHDAHEAYTGDLNSPMKRTYKMNGAGNRIQRVICKKYNIPFFSSEIKVADELLIATEARDLMERKNVDPRVAEYWKNLPYPMTEVIVPWNARKAKVTFTILFYFYGGFEVE